MDTGITATRAPDKAQVPPPNPYYKPPLSQDISTLDEGVVTLTMPAKLSAESFADFEAWMRLILRRLRRNAGLPPDPTPSPEGE